MVNSEGRRAESKEQTILSTRQELQCYFALQNLLIKPLIAQISTNQSAMPI